MCEKRWSTQKIISKMHRNDCAPQTHAMIQANQRLGGGMNKQEIICVITSAMDSMMSPAVTITKSGVTVFDSAKPDKRARPFDATAVDGKIVAFLVKRGMATANDIHVANRGITSVVVLKRLEALERTGAVIRSTSQHPVNGSEITKWSASEIGQ